MGQGTPKGHVDHEDEPVSRRGLLKKAGGAVAAGVAGAAVGNALGAGPAAADDLDPVRMGVDNVSQHITAIWSQGLLAGAFFAAPRQYGLRGISYDRGVIGESTAIGSIGVEGKVTNSSATGVQGKTTGVNNQVGVRGTTQSGNGEGIGVHGVTVNGVGVRGESTGNGGVGLQVLGRAFFSRSGIVGFAKGQTSATLTVPRLDTYSIVLATVQGAVAGTFVLGVVPDPPDARFTIRLNKAAPAALRVGWFVVN